MDIAIISNNLLKPLPSFYLTDPQHTHSSLQNCLPWILSDHRPKWSNEWSSHMLHLWSGTVWFHMISTLRCSEIRNCFPLHIPCKLHLRPNLYPMLALVNSPMESRSDDFFEEKDVKKDEKARHSEIKSLSQNHKEKRIPTGVRNRIDLLLSLFHPPILQLGFWFCWLLSLSHIFNFTNEKLGLITHQLYQSRFLFMSNSICSKCF